MIDPMALLIKVIGLKSQLPTFLANEARHVVDAALLVLAASLVYFIITMIIIIGWDWVDLVFFLFRELLFHVFCCDSIN